MTQLRRHKRLILTGLSALMLSGLSATPGYALVGGGAEPAPAPAADDGRRRNLTSSTTYLPLAPLATTVQANFRHRGMLQIEAGLEFETTADRARAERYMPRLRDAYASALSHFAGANYRFGDVPDTDRLAELLQDATDHVLGADKGEVLLAAVMVHAD
ncbi:hypothetical protein RMQ97_00225 [Maricaulis sp. D1M11]|uniref:hypothetical protein n=1 Tax=Maricaulis sp. D1M11 TaxID=3076117 RepID=UPI0039B673FC